MKKNNSGKNKVLILYHSGAGSTRTIVEIYKQLLQPYTTVHTVSVTTNIRYDIVESSDLLIFAFPTYHCAPSTSMIRFIQEIQILKYKAKAFVFTTYGLYSGNAIRIFSQIAKKKNITTVGYSDYKSPATDGSLLFPQCKFLYKYEKGIGYRIRKDIDKIRNILDSEYHREDIPAFKLYSILNAPNKYFGEQHKPTINIVRDACIQCNKCISDCPNYCWSVGEDNFPVFNKTNCERCYRCIHHCSRNAVILSSRTMKKKKLDKKFYQKLKKDIINDISG